MEHFDIFLGSNAANEEINKRKKRTITTLSAKSLRSSFNEATSSKTIIDSDEESKMIKAFDRINSIIFAGFDYLHFSVASDMIQGCESLCGLNSDNLTILINEEQLFKLKQVIDCLNDFEFIIDKDEEKNIKYSIWYTNSNVAINLIPFRRENDEIFVNMKSFDNVYNGFIVYSSNEHNEIPYNSTVGVCSESELGDYEFDLSKKLKFHVNNGRKKFLQ